ncbi:MAG TPA: Gfo/Idh/MocA family oxidoreductase, partial [Blastocatellia bacterium]|nr:Gfo/Idh/MocA family oxidoreductase [Blastocatellia bacterium]
IVQVGSQHVSNPSNERALEIIKSGKLGKITMITGYNYRNTGTGAWYYPIPHDASPQTIDWKRFLGSAPQREFDARRFFQWRLFWDYSGGLPTDLFVHLTTAVHTLMGVKMPSRVIGLGSIHHWKNYREVPDLITGIAEYPEGFNFIMNATANNAHRTPMLSILGTEGTLDYYESRLVYYPEPMLEDFTYSTNSWPAETKKKYAEMNDLDPALMRPNATAKMQRPKSEEIETPGMESTQAHLAKFYDSVRTRKEPFENAEMGSQCATVGHMVNLSMKARKEAKWDAAKQRVIL